VLVLKDFKVQQDPQVLRVLKDLKVLKVPLEHKE
jgi:hypothetical protein